MKPLHLITLGDSITVGTDGTRRVDQPWPMQVAKQLNLELENLAIAGATVFDNFPQQAMRVTADEPSVVTVMMGTNDYLFGDAQLDEVTATSTHVLTDLQRHANLQVVGILPLPCYYYGSPDAVGPVGFSEEMLWQTQRTIFKELTIPFIDWTDYDLVTLENHEHTLNDHLIHPSQQTYNAMSDTIAKFISTTL